MMRLCRGPLPGFCASKYPTGSVLVLSALLIVFIVGLAAFCVDLGYIELVKGEIQNSADSGALAGATAMLTDDMVKTPPVYTSGHSSARSASTQYVSWNVVGGSYPQVDPNSSNSSDGDIVLGFLDDPTDISNQLDLSDPTNFNAIQVRVQKNSAKNGRIRAYFSRIWGNPGTDAEAFSTAVVSSSVTGFQPTSDTGNSKILPVAMSEDDWNDLIDNGNGTDDFAVSSDGTVSAGNDDILEVKIFPLANSPSGNFGTVKFDMAGNTADLSRQILEGLSADDLQAMGGSLQLGADGTLQLGGDTGISAGMMDELEAIKGQRRIIFLYSTVTGEGANASYTIVGFVGVRVVDVKLTGALSEKKLVIQPSVVVDDTAIISNTTTQSKYVYSTARLAR